MILSTRRERAILANVRRAGFFNGTGKNLLGALACSPVTLLEIEGCKLRSVFVTIRSCRARHATSLQGAFTSLAEEKVVATSAGAVPPADRKSKVSLRVHCGFGGPCNLQVTSCANVESLKLLEESAFTGVALARLWWEGRGVKEWGGVRRKLDYCQSKVRKSGRSPPSVLPLTFHSYPAAQAQVPVVSSISKLLSQMQSVWSWLFV